MWSLVFISTRKDSLDLETSAEGLVVEQPCLEIRDEREPRRDGHRTEDH